ncbi:MAG: threonine synthase [Duncaniella sp.]|nr:threonine synthase [Duncaniella sp.]
MSLRDIAFVVTDMMLGKDIPSAVIRRIVDETFSFDIPLAELEPGISSLELFHGPTRAFKDIGARFLARVISHYSSQAPSRRVKVLVATSGDSGAAVAAGFHGVPGVETYILYPSGGLSRSQVARLSLPGSSVKPIEVLGTFDDCQRLVKQAFVDSSLRRDFGITSANSINICRLLPQMVYFFHAYALLSEREELQGRHLESPVVFSIPSGNLGNLTAGLLARRMGLPVDRFVVANNSNDVTARFLSTGQFEPRRAVRTVANAMDVGNPSNISRILDILEREQETPDSCMRGYSLSDDEIEAVMRNVHSATGVLLDPHSAAALGALRSDLRPGEQGVFLATAHPSKFPRVVEQATGVKLPPGPAAAQPHRSAPHPRISVSYDALRRLISV